MTLIFHKKPIGFSAKTLNTLLDKYTSYTEEINPTGDDRMQYDEYSNAVNLIAGGIKIIKSSRDSLQSLVDKLEKEFDDSKTKGNKKDLINEIEDIDLEYQFTEKIARANEMIYVLEARLTESRNKLHKLAQVLGVDPQRSEISPNKNHNTSGAKKDVSLKKHPSGELDNSSICEQDCAWLSEDLSDNICDTEDVICRTLKPSQLQMPKFYGDEEEFPEFWAVFQTLVHENKVLSTIEKMLLLKDSLRGKAEIAVKGIQLLPKNYIWMTEALKKKYGNKPINRSKVVQKLIDMRPAANNADACNNVFDKIRMLINQMVSAGQDIRSTQDALWTEKILEKFPYSIVKNVLIATQERDEVKIDDIMDELEKQIDAKKYVESRLRNFPRHDLNGKKVRSYREQSDSESKKCVFCKNSNHTSNVCRTVVDINERRNVVKKEQRCWKCFTDSHKSSECSKNNCPRCKQMHDISLCFATSPPQKGTSSGNEPRQRLGFQPRTNGQPEQKNPFHNRVERQPWTNNGSNDARNNRPWPGRTTANNACVNSDHTGNNDSRNKEQIVLMTAEGSVWNYNTNQFEKILFFFDTGAQKTLIREQTAYDLALPKESSEICAMSGIGGHTEKFQSSVVTLKICTAYGMELVIRAQTKPIITNGFSSVKLSNEDKQFLQLNELCVCNPRVRGEHQNPHILVGLDYYYQLVPPNSISLQMPSGLHIAKTIFGPSIHGRGILTEKQLANTAQSNARGLVSNDLENDAVLQQLTAINEPTEAELLNKLFELQGLGISSNELIKEENTFSYYQMYSKRIQFNNGFVTAPLPLKDNVVDLTDNYAIAYRRLISLWKHLQANKEQQKCYTQTFQDYISTKVVERANENTPDSVGCYYMPHSGVWRPAKAKPLRIVFDASSKRCGQLSLNDTIYTGESFVNKIHDILIASRTGKIILLCDIQAAFTQIRLQEEHKDLCRFLWFKDANKSPTRDNIQEYRFTRLPFGLTASPSILNMVILAYLNHKNTEIAREIIDHLYVDNILLRANTVEEALRKYKDSKAIFAEIGMNLREYISNSSEVNAGIPENDRLNGTVIKLLGVDYNIETDEFQGNIRITQKDRLTKRDIVSQLNSTYDPIGMMGPLLIKMKSLMREIYDTAIEWNDPISSELRRRWNNACQEVNNVSIRIPRAITNLDDVGNDYTLWIICDASKMAIAACAYLQNNANYAVSQLISGKTRLTPKKTIQTIPRLELLGVLIGMRLAKTLLNKLGANTTTVCIASDSEIALAWLKSTRKLPPFVTNQKERILQIKQVVEETGKTTVNFYYVPTHYNPADAGTRGLTACAIANHDWVRGPRWLEKGPKCSPLRGIENVKESGDIMNTDEAAQPDMIISHPMVTIPNQLLVDTTRFSKYTRVLRVLAMVGKTLSKWAHQCNLNRSTNIAVENLSSFSQAQQICSEDIAIAEKLLLVSEHRNINLEELRRRFPHMSIVRDQDEVIRYESRIRNAILPHDTKLPIYIPNNSDLARLLIEHTHRTNAHCGRDHVLALMRQRFWIPQPSRAVKKFLKNCVTCKRCHGLPFGAPDMPPLPKDRVVIAKPFQNVGCDFLGPYDSKDMTKMYVCLYTCLTTRAVHLEVVENMTATAFLNSFTRFISRRGVPKLIRTDCGTNFKLGQAVIENLFKNNDTNDHSVMSYSASEGIRWVFNPPSAPWMGGVWERLVGSIKRCFSKAIGRKKLTFTEMATAITRIEAIINTRPLTKVSLTDLDEIPLRPIDFLQGNLKFALPSATQLIDWSDRDFDPELIQSISQAKEAIVSSETIAAKFWERWNREYLTAMRDSHTKNLDQPRHVSKYPQLGEIVIIEQDYLPRGNWFYGKIIELIKSADGMIRSAKVRMPNHTVLHRPLNKIYPLEIRSCGEAVEEGLDADQTITQSRSREEGNSGEPNTAELTTPLGSSRRNPERASKTRAYDVIQNYERHLDSPSSQGSTYFSKWTMLTIFLFVISAVSADNSLICADGSAVINIQNASFELCFNRECRIFTNTARKLVLKIPASSLHKLATVSTRILKSNSTETVECPPTAFCEHASQLMTTSLIGNPHCWPIGAIATIAITAYILGAIILLCVRFIRQLVNKRSTNTQTTQEIVVMNSFNPRPLSVYTRVTTMVVILAMLSISEACQHGYMRHTVEMVCNNKGNCSYEYNQEVLFNHIHSELCINARYENKTIGVIKIRQKPLQLTCSKVSQFFARETKHQISYITRCAEAGSCTQNRCNTLKPHENIEELKRVSKYPGYSACEHTCGGLLCGCFLPVAACSFIKVAHIPISKSVYEIVNCEEWIPLIEFEVEFKVHKLERNREVTLMPYITQSFEEISLTVISIQKPNTPLFDQRYAISEKDALIIPNNFELPVRCTTADMAANHFVNCSNQMVCNCKSYKTPKTCHCPQHSIKDMRAEIENRLPIYTPVVEISSKNGQIYAHSTKSEVTLAIKSSLLINSAEFVIEQKCSIKLSTVKGCYKCQEGAEVTAFCTTGLESVVTIQCENTAFAIDCDPSNRTTKIALEFSKSIITQKCFAICDKTEISLELKGQLHYHVRYFPTNVFDDTDNYATTWPSFKDFHFPDLEPVINIIKNKWKVTLLALGVTATALGITYMFGPVALIMISRIIGSIIQIVVKVAKDVATRTRKWLQKTLK